jgi:hypothetical protein
VSLESSRNADDVSSVQSSRNKPQSPNEQDGEIIRALRKNSNPFLRNTLSHMRLDNDSARTASQSRSSLRLEEGSKSRHSTSRLSHSSSEITLPVSNRREDKTSGGGMNTFLDDLKREYEGKRHSGPTTPVTAIYYIYEKEFDEEDWRPPHPPPDPLEHPRTGTPQPTSGHRKAVSGSNKVSRKEDQAHLSPHGIDSPITPRGSRRRGRIQERAPSNPPIHCKSPKSSKSSSSRHPDGKRRSSRSSSSGRSRQQSSRSSRSRSSSSGSRKPPPSGSRPCTPSKRHRQPQEVTQTESPRPKTPSRTSRQQQTTSPRRSRSNSTNRDREAQDLSPLRRPKTPSLRTRRSLQSPMSQSQTPSTRSNHSKPTAPPIFSPAFSTDNAAPAVKRDRPQREFADAIDWKGLSPRIHGNVCVIENVKEQELKKPNQNRRQSLDSGSSDETPPDHPILNQVRRWNQQYVENNDNASLVHQMEKFGESFSSRASRSVLSARLLASLYDDEKNEEYLEQAKERHQARRHSFNSVEDFCLDCEDISLPLPQQEDIVETTTEQEPAETSESRIRESSDETPKGMPILNHLRKWSKKHINKEEDEDSSLHQSQKFHESFLSRASLSLNSVKLRACLYDEEKNEDYLERARQRHQERRHSLGSVEVVSPRALHFMNVERIKHIPKLN